MTARSIATKSILAALAFGSSALAACSTSDPTTAKPGSGGSAGTSGTAGASGSGTTAGASGSGTSGSAGSAGSVNAMGVPCLPIAASGLITDFSPTDGGPTDQTNFGDLSTTLTGSTFVYPNTSQMPMPMYPLTSDNSAGNWHISGDVGDYSGFGFALQVQQGTQTVACNKIDASAFSGISFTVSGTVDMGSAIQLNVGTAGDALADSWFNQLSGVMPQTTYGRCVPKISPTASGTTQYSQSDCAQPFFAVPVSTSPTTVTVHWTDLMGGKPEASPNPSEITYISFNFPNPANPGQPTVVKYHVDIVIDDLKFVH